MQFNAREAFHMLELRSGPQGHPAYRTVAQEMHRLIDEQAGHRTVAAAMQHLTTEAPAGRWGLPPHLALGPSEHPLPDRAWTARGGYLRGLDERWDPTGFCLPAELFTQALASPMAAQKSGWSKFAVRPLTAPARPMVTFIWKTVSASCTMPGTRDVPPQRKTPERR